MREILEIVLCVLALFGVYSMLDMLKTGLSYPRRIRKALRGALILEDHTDVCDVARYARYLRREQKISSERLIILVKDDIIENGEYLREIGEVFAVREANIINRKEQNDDT